MAIKPGAKTCSIQEQIIEDLPSGLTLQVEAMGGGQWKLRIVGDLPLGNRELIFDGEGRLAGSGTFLGGACRPNWLRAVD